MVSNLRTTLREVIYTAAHSGFDLKRVPLGGAATLCERLQQAWKINQPFALRLLGPDLLGSQAPKDKDLVRYSEMRYARFCFEFEKALTTEILRQDPKKSVVLSNDVSEGPTFRLLAEKGYPIYTIYHVNVVDYVAALYGRGWFQPAILASLYSTLERSPLRPLLPAVLKLIFEKQRDSLFYSRGVIVPSEGMKRTLMASYPRVNPETIHVLPWGTSDETFDEAAVQAKAQALRRHYQIPEGAHVLITLSRISPEKGQDLLLKAIQRWERASDFPEKGVWVLLCGEAAYMAGHRFQKRLEKLARRLKKAHVIFPGYLTGLEKQAHFRLAELYVFPSRHESYGLTLLEAFQAGLPALAAHHYGAEDLLNPGFGELLPPIEEPYVPEHLLAALRRLLSDPFGLKEMGKRAQAFAEQQRFSETAERLADIILSE